ncbi:MAG: PIN domain nuclease [Kineosporiaceae bacterium]|nr:PIN domain nuclease [Kineosporiaceae bacterium]
MNLVDTSAWVDYLRAAPTPATAALRELLSTEPGRVAICEPIAMELLAGAGEGIRLARLEHLVNGLPSLSVEPATDFRAAATIYRAGRRAGLTIRSLVDCLIAAQAIRHDVALIHKDVDYEVIAQLTPLRAISLR